MGLSKKIGVAIVALIIIIAGIAFYLFLTPTLMPIGPFTTRVIWYERDFNIEPDTNYYREFKVDKTSRLSVYLHCQNPSGVIVWGIIESDARTFEESNRTLGPLYMDFPGKSLISHTLNLERGTYTIVFIQMNNPIGITKIDIDVKLE